MKVVGVNVPGKVATRPSTDGNGRDVSPPVKVPVWRRFGYLSGPLTDCAKKIKASLEQILALKRIRKGSGQNGSNCDES